jgi:nitroreductase
MIEAGIWAPSAKNGQQWRFTVLTGTAKQKFMKYFHEQLQQRQREGAEALGSSLNSCRIMQEAPVLVMVWNAGGLVETIDNQSMSRARKLAHMAELQGVSAAIQNMLLVAYSCGLGSLWINDIYYAVEALEQYFSKPWELVAAVSLGWPSEQEQNKEPPNKMGVDEVTEFL